MPPLRGIVHAAGILEDSTVLPNPLRNSKRSSPQKLTAPGISTNSPPTRLLISSCSSPPSPPSSAPPAKPTTLPPTLSKIPRSFPPRSPQPATPSTGAPGPKAWPPKLPPKSARKIRHSHFHRAPRPRRSSKPSFATHLPKSQPPLSTGPNSTIATPTIIFPTSTPRFPALHSPPSQPPPPHS